MSVQHHPSSMRRPSARRPLKDLESRARRLSPSWRWLAEAVWWIEHGFERARADARPEEDSRVRIFLVMAVFGLVFSGLALRAGYAALLEPVGEAYAGVASDRSRADLTDRNGRLLATDVIFYAMFIDPSQVWDRDLAFREIRRVMPELDADRLKGALWGNRQVIVASGLTPQERARVHDLGLGGVTFSMEDGRVYPLEGGQARHLIGATDTGGQGISGVELAFDKELRADGAAGEPFALSIDLRIQGVVESELAATMAETQAKAGVAIVTNVQTGEVLAMASWPDSGSRNLATSGHYEMGSVFKSFTVAAGLDTGAADMATLFDASEPFMIGNRRITDFHAQNRVMTLEEVYLHSSNIGTSRLAVQMGPDVMKDYFGRLGLLDRAPIELVESAAPRVPRDWSPSTLASLSFGYGIMVTPVQVITAVGALSNGGRYVPLSLRKGGSGAEPKQVVSVQTSVNMLDLMRRNVVRGSGGRANAAGLRVGGKTGSANKWTGSRYDPAVAVGTFIGVFPSDGPLDAPRYAILVLVDEPGSYPRTGGFVAAPAVGRIAERIAPFVGVNRADDAWQLADGRPNPTLKDMEASL